jgi:hypothetical protein
MIMVAAAGCLLISVSAAATGYSELTRKPTAAEFRKAAAAEVARRWMGWPVGKIFPSTLGYQAGPGVNEAVQRAGIGTGTSCGPATGPSLTGLLSRYGCRAVVRASYTDNLQGVVYTIGVAAFPAPGQAAAVKAGLPDPLPPAAGLRALPVGGTAAALFTDQARQSTTVSQSGPYLVLTTAGYSDGRPAEKTGQARPDIFSPASQLAQAVLNPLAAPATPRCGTPQWQC